GPELGRPSKADSGLQGNRNKSLPDYAAAQSSSNPTPAISIAKTGSRDKCTVTVRSQREHARQVCSQTQPTRPVTPKSKIGRQKRPPSHDQTSHVQARQLIRSASSSPIQQDPERAIPSTRTQ
ncbi:hypothetical protein PSTG_19566, partial [Puccinia striiformis f. sp. tritici PST-78]